MTVRVQEADFDLGAELLALRAADSRVGALASFLGLVRDMNDGASVAEMTLEHYPGMTEKALEEIVVEARGRWDIYDALVIHRVGPLKPCDQIVLVAVTGACVLTSWGVCGVGALRRGHGRPTDSGRHTRITLASGRHDSWRNPDPRR